MPTQPNQESSGFESPSPFGFSSDDLHREDISPANSVFTLEKYMHHRRWVVKKKLKEDFKHDFLWQQTLRREFEFGYKLSHKGLAQYFHLEDRQDCLYLIREWIDGESLSSWNQAKRSTKDKTEILIKTAEVLEYLHAHQVFHRDVSPANIIVCHLVSEIKLIDPGFAAEGAERLPGAGTRGFSSEEQLGGAAPNPRHDLYSLGQVAKFLFQEKNVRPRYITEFIEYCTTENGKEKSRNATEARQMLLQKSPSPSRIIRMVSLIILMLMTFLIMIFIQDNNRKVPTNRRSYTRKNPAVKTEHAHFNTPEKKEKAARESNIKTPAPEPGFEIRTDTTIQSILSRMRNCLAEMPAAPAYAGEGRKKNLRLQHLDRCGRAALDEYQFWLNNNGKSASVYYEASLEFQKHLSAIQDSVRKQVLQ
jgi:serine/threonine protein kinase